MFIETKKRIVASLVTLSLVFGVLACFYLLSHPQSARQPMQAVVAGVVLGVTALIVHFLPARQIQTPAPLSAGVRSWSVDPSFEPVAAAAAEPASTSLGVAPSVLAMSTAAVLGAPTAAPAPAPIVNPVAPPSAPAPPAVPVAPPLPAPSLAQRMAELDADSDTLTIPQLAPAFAPRGRNDDVLVEEEAEDESAAVPLIEVAVAPASPMPVATAAPQPKTGPAAPAPTPEVGSDEIGWRGPEPDASPDLLRRLVDYWHSEYMHEHERLENLRVLYRRSVERLDRLQATAPVLEDSPLDPSPQEILRATKDLAQLSAEPEEHADSATLTMEHFH